jgi:hypothetical protein
VARCHRGVRSPARVPANKITTTTRQQEHNNNNHRVTWTLAVTVLHSRKVVAAKFHGHRHCHDKNLVVDPLGPLQSHSRRRCCIGAHLCGTALLAGLHRVVHCFHFLHCMNLGFVLAYFCSSATAAASNRTCKHLDTVRAITTAHCWHLTFDLVVQAQTLVKGDLVAVAPVRFTSLDVLVPPMAIALVFAQQRRRKIAQ